MPTRFMRDSPSGSNARRAGIGLVPIFFFQACGSEAGRREESSPTPSRVLLNGRSEIMVVIRLPASVIVLVRYSLGVRLGKLGVSLSKAPDVRSHNTSVLMRLDLLE